MIINGAHYITEKEVATEYGRSVKWVQNIRYSDKHFPHYKLNGRVFFNKMEVDRWFTEHLKPVH